MSHIDGLTDGTPVRFQPPDEDWRNHIDDLTGNALNLYLADLRETRKLGSNQSQLVRTTEHISGRANDSE